MIDIHTHILPGVDDGAMNIEESVCMARIAFESGTKVIAATPHANAKGGFEAFQVEVYEQKLEELRRALLKEEIPLKIVAGMELFATKDLGCSMEDKGVLSLNYSKYFLIEFDFDVDYDDMWECFDDILERGAGIPVIAHPERYACVGEKPRYLENFLKAGCLTQVNRGSLLGRFGSRIQACVHDLLKRNMVTCVASDAHHANQRSPYMADVKEYLERYESITTAEKLLSQNPLKILRNQNVKMV